MQRKAIKNWEDFLTSGDIWNCTHQDWGASCLCDTLMNFIPEWVSFQSEVRNAFTHLHDWIKLLSIQCKGFSLEWCTRQDEIWTPWLTPDYTICDCQFETKFFFSLHDTRMKFRTRTRISFGMKTGMISFRNDWYGNNIKFQLNFV